MKDRFFLSLLILLSLSTIQIYAQQKSRVAVLPFAAVEAPASEARVVTSLFETALVKTGVYNVIEQNQISEILDAQSFSLSGCTDDACAVEVGKLLAAELIILGELSKVGGRYIANAKIIDVGMGRNVNADSVSAADITEMTDTAVNLLAYKLAGLTYSSGGGERIAEAFGELYVSTEPDGADVFINGMRRGTSPLVVDKVPLGSIRVTARKGNLTCEETVELKSVDLVEVMLALKVSLGRLFIKSPERYVEVFLDGEPMGPLAGGLFKDLPSGEHMLTLKGEGLFWEDTINLEAEKTTTIEAYPSPFGILDYTLPEGAVCGILGIGEGREITGSGRIELPVGSYRLTVTGENYLAMEETVGIQRGVETVFAASLQYTEEYAVALKAEKRDLEKEQIKTLLTGLEGRIGTHPGDYGEAEKDLQDARNTVQRIDESGYSFPELEQRAVRVLSDALSGCINELEALSERDKQNKASLAQWRWVSFGAGAVGFILTGVAYAQGEAEYEVYHMALTTAESEASHERLETYAGRQTFGILTGLAGTLGGVAMTVRKDAPDPYVSEIAKLASEKAALEGGM